MTSSMGRLGSHLRLQSDSEPSSSIKKCLSRIEVIRPFLNSGDVGAELGVFKGNFIDHLLTTDPRKLYCVDPWYRSGREWAWAQDDPSTINALLKIIQEFRSDIEDGRVVPVVDYSQNFLRSLPDNSLDWVYIDSTHSYAQTKLELELSCRKVKLSGYILGDDYDPNPNHKHHGVWKAVQEFCADGSIRLLVDGTSRQFVASVNV